MRPRRSACSKQPAARSGGSARDDDAHRASSLHDRGDDLVVVEEVVGQERPSSAVPRRSGAPAGPRTRSAYTVPESSSSTAFSMMLTSRSHLVENVLFVVLPSTLSSQRAASSHSGLPSCLAYLGEPGGVGEGDGAAPHERGGARWDRARCTRSRRAAPAAGPRFLHRARGALEVDEQTRAVAFRPQFVGGGHGLTDAAAVRGGAAWASMSSRYSW